MAIFIYCRNQSLTDELSEALVRRNADFELFKSSTEMVDRTIEEKPEVVVLCLDKEDQWAAVGVAAIRKSCAKTRIIYVSQKPSMDDGKSLEQGIFYYAGNASSKDILEAVRAAGNVRSARWQRR